MRKSFLLIVFLAIPAVARADSPDPGPNRKDEPLAKHFSAQKAAEFLDAASRTWLKTRNCFTCHTNYAYLYARPVLSAEAPAHGEVRRALEDLVQKRWREKGPRWDAEVVASAAALAYNDAATTGHLHPATRIALDRMWQVQKADGGWSWLKCDWPPMENDDHYGATLAAIAVGVAPGNYAATVQAQKGMVRIRKYFQANPPQNLHHRAMLLWASSYFKEGFLSDKEKKDTIQALRALQRPDGGWSAASLGQWKRGDKKKQDPATSDGYGTGFVIFVLRRAGVPAGDPVLQRGLAWIKSNQRHSGRWFTRSLHSDSKHFLTHAGSAFAVMALGACDALPRTISASKLSTAR
jgi:squalene-hopene/tetraprenyl-beta-curcumene cyclase